MQNSSRGAFSVFNAVAWNKRLKPEGKKVNLRNGDILQEHRQMYEHSIRKQSREN